MIEIKPEVNAEIENYVNYLIDSGETTQTRAFNKKKLMIESLQKNLGGILTHRPSTYKDLGRDEGCRLFVYIDKKSKSQWGFAHKVDEDNNVIIYHMKNMKLVKENKEVQKSLDFMWRLLKI